MIRYIKTILLNLAVVGVFIPIYYIVGRVSTALIIWIIFYCFLVLLYFINFIRWNRE